MTKNEIWDQQFSFLTEEHRDSLLVCWKIRTGIKKGIELSRIKAYADWHFNTRLLPHIYKEEVVIIHLLGKKHPLVAKSLAQHRRLKRLFRKPSELIRQLNSIEEELEINIRFEEHKLFTELKNSINSPAFDPIEFGKEEAPLSEDWADCFWEEHHG